MRLIGRRPALVLAVALVAVVALGAFLLRGPLGDWLAFGGDPNEICAGVSRDLGGCDPDQPTFTAITCAGVGEEFGRQLDRRALTVINGPASVQGESRASRLGEVVGLVSVRANQYLRQHGMVADCDVPEFLAAAETQFSAELKSKAGDHLYDGASRPYAEWLAEVRSVLRMIDQDEGEPAAPPSA